MDEICQMKSEAQSACMLLSYFLTYAAILCQGGLYVSHLQVAAEKMFEFLRPSLQKHFPNI